MLNSKENVIKRITTPKALKSVKKYQVSYLLKYNIIIDDDRFSNVGVLR